MLYKSNTHTTRALLITLLLAAPVCLGQPAPYRGAGAPQAPGDIELADLLASRNNGNLNQLPPPTEAELRQLEAAKPWLSGSEKPVRGDDGRLMYTYGVSMPVVVCKPMFTTDIMLQAGEVVLADGVQLGDTTRWLSAPGTSGEKEESTHILIKPTDTGLATNLVIMTNRRTYHLNLISRNDTDWVPSIGFIYPDEAKARWQAFAARERKDIAARTIPQTGLDIARLNFDYAIEGKAPWKPLRVYTDGNKTYIQFAKTLKNTTAPVLFLIDDTNQQTLTNYRIQGDTYVVDLVFTKAVLITGIGKNQSKIEITKN
jgi:type IV secretion system protein VirB9